MQNILVTTWNINPSSVFNHSKGETYSYSLNLPQERRKEWQSIKGKKEQFFIFSSIKPQEQTLVGGHTDLTKEHHPSEKLSELQFNSQTSYC